jgi:hypothetical protein
VFILRTPHPSARRVLSQGLLDKVVDELETRVKGLGRSHPVAVLTDRALMRLEAEAAKQVHTPPLLLLSPSNFQLLSCRLDLDPQNASLGV